MGRRVVVGQDHVSRLDFAVVPAVQRHPPAALVLAELPHLLTVLLLRSHLVDPAVDLLRAAGTVPAQAERRGRGGAEARVGQPDLLAGPHPERQVRARPGPAAVRADPAEQPFHAEPEALQHRAEQLGLLVAVAAAATVDDLVLDRLQVHVHVAGQEDVEVLEADRGQVRAVKRVQGRLGRLRRPLVAHPAQVSVQVEPGDAPLVVSRAHRLFRGGAGVSTDSFGIIGAQAPAAAGSAGAGLAVIIFAMSAPAATPPASAPTAVSRPGSAGPSLYLPGPVAASASASVA
jgi:hypothetical protein